MEQITQDSVLAGFIKQLEVVEAKLYILSEKVRYGLVTEEEINSKVLSLNAEFEFLAEFIQETQDHAHSLVSH